MRYLKNLQEWYKYEEVNEIVKSLDSHSVEAYYKDVVTIENVVHALWSRWTVRKVHFTPLIVSLR